MKEYIIMYENMEILVFDKLEPIMAILKISTNEYYHIFKAGHIFHYIEGSIVNQDMYIDIDYTMSDVEISIRAYNYIYNIEYRELYDNMV